MNNRLSLIRKPEELNEDIKNDLFLGFNLMKNNRDKLSKLKLRSLLFNFAMYKSSPNEINDYINEVFPRQDEFSYDDFLRLVTLKYSYLKEKEFEDTWNLFSSSKHGQSNKEELVKCFVDGGIDVNEKEVEEMVWFINKGKDGFSKEEFKMFIHS